MSAVTPPSPAPPPAGPAQPPRGRVHRAYEHDAYQWNLGRVPDTLTVGGNVIAHPARTCAIFVVHGMGEQAWTATAAGLRAGFEDALDAIEEWQRSTGGAAGTAAAPQQLPPPFVFDGYWADYADLSATFPEDWQRFNERERRFFGGLWQRRTMSLLRTLGWFVRQQLRLLWPRIARDVGWTQYLLYVPLQVLGFGAFVYAAIRHPTALTHVVADVRLYASPRGVAERAIVQRIDYRVGQKFLQLIGLDWDFRPLPSAHQIQAGAARVAFEHVVWVAHSLGTVVSYNVLSDLFARAAHIQAGGDDEQRRGVARFRKALLRFVTLGSPLNKFAYLFSDAVRPWPAGARRGLLDGGEDVTRGGEASREWWINFYHVLDPVSAPLVHRAITGGTPPFNFHIDWKQVTALIPGVAHVAYWSDLTTLRFVLGRLYGHAVLPDRQYVPKSARVLKACAFFGYLTWAALVGGGVWALWVLAPLLLQRALDALFGT